jgi:hypothetical protein
MRASRLAVCLLMCLFGSGVVACSGSDQRAIPIDAPPPPPDTPSNPPPPNPPPDAGVTCAQRGTLNATTALDFSTAQVPGRVPANGTELMVAVVVTTNPARTMGFVIAQRNNTGVFASATGKAGRFEKPPATGLYAMDTDGSFGFAIDFVDGITVNADGSVSIRPTQIALLDPIAGGSVRIDSWTPAATPGGTSTIGATVSNAKFKGFNVLANGSQDPVGNGCDILVQNLQFKNLSVKWQTAPFPENVTARLPLPPDFAPWTLDGAAVLQAESATGLFDASSSSM